MRKYLDWKKWETDLNAVQDSPSATKTTEPAIPGFEEYGGECIRKAIAKMLDLTESVRERADDEAVHDMRVASRRLRAAISIFEPAFAGKRFERFRRHVKQLTDALSRARDLDVMIVGLNKLAEEIPESERKGLEEYRDNLMDLRNVLQAEVRSSLKDLESADLMGEFNAISGPPDSGPSQSPPDSPVINLEGEFAFAIHARIRDLRSWERFVLDARRVHELHQMRIAAKRLRYTMELFAPFRGPIFSSAIDQIRRIQDFLGKIHDADVLVPDLLIRIRANLKRVKMLDQNGIYAVEVQHQVGLLAAANIKRIEREDHYSKFLVLWRAMQKGQLLDHILGMTQNHPDIQRETLKSGTGEQNGKTQQ